MFFGGLRGQGGSCPGQRVLCMSAGPAWSLPACAVGRNKSLKKSYELKNFLERERVWCTPQSSMRGAGGARSTPRCSGCCQASADLPAPPLVTNKLTSFEFRTVWSYPIETHSETSTPKIWCQRSLNCNIGLLPRSKLSNKVAGQLRFNHTAVGGPCLCEIREKNKIFWIWKDT